MAHTTATEQESQIKKLKHDYEGWRELILTFNSVLLWEKQWYPGLIGGISSILFLIFWLWDPSILTAIATVFLLINITEIAVPRLMSTIYQSNSWNGAKEKKFEEICRALVASQFKIYEFIQKCQDFKVAKPKMYYSITTLTLVLISWIGNQVNNLFLTYLLTNLILLLPGVLHYNLLDRYCSQAVNRFTDIYNNLKAKVDGTPKIKTN